MQAKHLELKLGGHTKHRDESCIVCNVPKRRHPLAFPLILTQVSSLAARPSADGSVWILDKPPETQIQAGSDDFSGA